MNTEGEVSVGQILVRRSHRSNVIIFVRGESKHHSRPAKIKTYNIRTVTGYSKGSSSLYKHILSTLSTTSPCDEL